MTDETESIRRNMVAEINAEPGSREHLEAEHGQVGDTDELQRDFHVLGFLTPLVVVFGHADGDQTLGRVVKLMPTRAKVEALEERGGRPAGVRWNVPHHLMRSADDEQAPATSEVE